MSPGRLACCSPRGASSLLPEVPRSARVSRRRGDGAGPVGAQASKPQGEDRGRKERGGHRTGRIGLADSPRTPGRVARLAAADERPPVARRVSRRVGGSGPRRGLAPRIGRVRRDSSSRLGGGRPAISAKSRPRRGALPVVRHGGSADLRFGRAGLADSPRTPGGAPRSRSRPAAARWVSRRAGGSGRRRGLAPRIGGVRRDSSSRLGAAAGDRSEISTVSRGAPRRPTRRIGRSPVRQGRARGLPPHSRRRAAFSQSSRSSPVGLSAGWWLRSAKGTRAANRGSSTRLVVPVGGGGRRSQRNLDSVAGRSPSSDTADRPISGSAGPGSRTPPHSWWRGAFSQASPSGRWVSRGVGAPVGEGVSRRQSVESDATPPPGWGWPVISGEGGGGRRSPRGRCGGAPRRPRQRIGRSPVSAGPGSRPAPHSRRRGAFSQASPSGRWVSRGVGAPVGEGVSRRQSVESDATPPPGWGWPVISGEGGGGRRSPRGRCGGAPRRPRQRIGRSPVSAGPGSRPAPHSRRRGAFSQASRGSPVGLSTGGWLRSVKGFRAANRLSPTRLPVPAGRGGRRSRRAVGMPRGGQPEAASGRGPVGIVAPPVRDSRHSCFGRTRRRRRAARAGVGRAGC